LVTAEHRFGYETLDTDVVAALPKVLIAQLRQAGACLHEGPTHGLPPLPTSCAW
jgi:hypothetical protein